VIFLDKFCCFLLKNGLKKNCVSSANMAIFCKNFCQTFDSKKLEKRKEKKSLALLWPYFDALSK